MEEQEITLTKKQAQRLETVLKRISEDCSDWRLQRDYFSFQCLVLSILSESLSHDNIPYTCVYRAGRALCDEMCNRKKSELQKGVKE